MKESSKIWLLVAIIVILIGALAVCLHVSNGSNTTNTIQSNSKRVVVKHYPKSSKISMQKSFKESNVSKTKMSESKESLSKTSTNSK